VLTAALCGISTALPIFIYDLIYGLYDLGKFVYLLLIWLNVTWLVGNCSDYPFCTQRDRVDELDTQPQLDVADMTFVVNLFLALFFALFSLGLGFFVCCGFRLGVRRFITVQVGDRPPKAMFKSSDDEADASGDGSIQDQQYALSDADRRRRRRGRYDSDNDVNYSGGNSDVELTEEEALEAAGDAVGISKHDKKSARRSRKKATQSIADRIPRYETNRMRT
jgi:hypothetical protein